MSILRIDLLQHNFSRSLRGYNTDEVDSFLQEVADAQAQLSDERVKLLHRVSELEAKVHEYSMRENALHETLIATQRMAEEMKQLAQKEAQMVIDSAQAKAENILNQAQLKLARITEDTAEAYKLREQFELNLRATIEGYLKILDMRQKDLKRPSGEQSKQTTE